MSLKHILLGMLHEPASGYDLKNEFSESLSHFWAAKLSQIYPLLSSMEQEGLLKAETAASDKGPPRRVYSRTARGTNELVGWLAEGPHVTEERRHYLAQVYFLSAYGDPDQALRFMRSLRELMQKKLKTLEAAESHWREQDPGYPDDLPDEWFYPQMTLELGLKVFSANIEWCDRCIARIEKRISSRSATTRPR